MRSIATGLLIVALTAAGLALLVPGLRLTMSSNALPAPSSSGSMASLDLAALLSVVEAMATQQAGPLVIAYPTHTPTMTPFPTRSPAPGNAPVTCGEHQETGTTCRVDFFPPTRTATPTATPLANCATVVAHVATRMANSVAYLRDEERMCTWEPTMTPTPGRSEAT